ncbi:hypothetical protein PROFUN_02243 [Planoprotostelium fungivorum]|uniref:Uncharacterized protein n=1 Tax=Planoprotostelium fungivorum TaxID=1890364 RepID=A0A2P6NYD4_9EUKA|nr:hypothetical protein PROFUN_02243 [Planoprotostelium fungivorum]
MGVWSRTPVWVEPWSSVMKLRNGRRSEVYLWLNITFLFYHDPESGQTSSQGWSCHGRLPESISSQYAWFDGVGQIAREEDQLLLIFPNSRLRHCSKIYPEQSWISGLFYYVYFLNGQRTC